MTGVQTCALPIFLVLFSCGLLINSLFPVDSTLDLLSYYFATILHLGALFKSQHDALKKLKLQAIEINKH